jgi:hypothetical protein
MSFNPIVLVSGQVLTGSAAKYAQANAGKRVTIKSASITNTTASVVAVTVYRVASGGSVSAGNTIISARNVAPNETYQCPELINKVLQEGDSIWAVGAGLSLDVSGAESVVN